MWLQHQLQYLSVSLSSDLYQFFRFFHYFGQSTGFGAIAKTGAQSFSCSSSMKNDAALALAPTLAPYPLTSIVKKSKIDTYIWKWLWLRLQLHQAPALAKKWRL
jgi:hypothetical protein